MDGEAVAQRVHRDTHVDLRGVGRGTDAAVQLARAHCAKRFGCDRTTIRRRWRHAIETIASKLNEGAP